MKRAVWGVPGLLVAIAIAVTLMIVVGPFYAGSVYLPLCLYLFYWQRIHQASGNQAGTERT